jgi:hypothetical protein
MIKQLENLRNEDRELVIEAPVLVALLIAGVDNKIDKDEYNEAVRVIHTKAFSEISSLREVYQELESHVHESIDGILNRYSDDISGMRSMIEHRLAHLNDVFSQMDSGFAHRFYRSLKNLAYHVATKHHEFLGEKLTDHKTKELMELPMLKEPVTDLNA